MKKSAGSLLTGLAILITLNSHAQGSDYTVAERGANYSVWQRTVVENGTNVVHKYMEICSGLNFTNASGQWLPAKEEIDILPDGSAQAIEGNQKSYFPSDIYNGVIELVGPSGNTHLRSRPTALFYDDGSNTVMIAELTNSVGMLANSNQVIYPNAFDGVKASIRYTYKRASFEQDVILEEQLPSPETFGLNPQTTKLQLLTEFFGTNEPVQKVASLDQQDNLQDVALTFGKMKMRQGKAFAIGDSAFKTKKTPTYKQWLHLAGGRKFLLEELPMRNIAVQLQTLPTASNPGLQKSKVASAVRQLPPVRLAQATTNRIQLALADVKPKSGLVLDYVEVDSEIDSGFDFQAGQTYYVSGESYWYGDLTIEGGAVIKYAPGVMAHLDGAYSYIDCQTTPDRPAVFTSMNDDSVGERIDGSSGMPSGWDVPVFLDFLEGYQGNPGELSLHDLHFSYCVYGAIYQDTGSLTVDLWNCQFTHVSCAVLADNINLYNVLIENSAFYDNEPALFLEETSLIAENVTLAGGCCGLVQADSSGATVALTNCLIVSEPIVGYYSQPVTLLTNATVCVPSPTQPVFQSDGADNYYLTNNSPYRDIGTTDIDPDLLAELQTMTTYAPQDGSWPDTNAPDLGYHYPRTIIGSAGKDFWLMFFNTAYPNNGLATWPALSLVITSPGGASGTVTIWTNGPVLTVDGCEDPRANGRYVLTNLPAYIATAFVNEFGESAPNPVYLKDTNFVYAEKAGFQTTWYLMSYDPNTDSIYNPIVPLYSALGSGLNDIKWNQYTDWGAPPTSTVCTQYPLSLSFTLAAGGATNLLLPAANGLALPTGAMMWDYDRVEKCGIHVVADAPVSVYGMNYLSQGTAAYTGYATSLLGTNYCVLARQDDFASDPYGLAYSEFAIVATTDNTTVTILPSSTANLAGHAGPYNVILQQGQTYQINSSDYTSDVTGTWIHSDKPVGVFAGAKIAFVPNADTQAGNPLEQEQLPVESWGTNALSLSFAGRQSGDLYRVLAASNSTLVTITNSYGVSVVTNLNAGQYCETNLDGWVSFQSTQPIQVAKFGNGTEFDNQLGDPCEILLPTTGHYLATNVIFTLPNDNITGDFVNNYLNIIVPQSATNSTKVDGLLVAVTSYTAIGTSGYYGAQIVITTSGVHAVTSSQPVGVEVYGWGNADAYSYFGGIVK